MNITNNFRGTNILNWLLIIFISACFFSCRKDAFEPEQYHLTIRNNYFESVSVSIEPYFSENIVAGASSSSFFLPKGSYSIVAITKSQLKLKSTFTLQGKREQLIMKINEKGSFRIK